MRGDIEGLFDTCSVNVFGEMKKMKNGSRGTHLRHCLEQGTDNTVLSRISNLGKENRPSGVDEIGAENDAYCRREAEGPV